MHVFPFSEGFRQAGREYKLLALTRSAVCRRGASDFLRTQTDASLTRSLGPLCPPFVAENFSKNELPKKVAGIRGATVVESSPT